MNHEDFHYEHKAESCDIALVTVIIVICTMGLVSSIMSYLTTSLFFNTLNENMFKEKVGSL